MSRFLARIKHVVQRNSQTVLQCLDTLPPSSWAGTFSNIILVWHKNTAVVVEDVVSKVVTLGWVDDTAWRVGLSGSLQFIEELHWESAD